MAEKKTRGAGRTRSWTFVLYPESAPDDWRDKLDELHLQWIESPLHDKDVNADGEPKKPHWHILLMFDTVKDYTQVKALTESLNAPIPQKCASARGMVRYMVHMDNPEKYQYKSSDIISHGGADVLELLRPTATNRYDLIAEMMDFVQSQNIVEFEDLMDYARHIRREDWYSLLCDSCAIVMERYIRSRRHRTTKSKFKFTSDGCINEDTGEFLK